MNHTPKTDDAFAKPGTPLVAPALFAFWLIGWRLFMQVSNLTLSIRGCGLWQAAGEPHARLNRLDPAPRSAALLLPHTTGGGTTMATRAGVHHPQPDWQRIAALSTSFFMHAAAALVLAIPLAMQAERPVATIVEATMRSEPLPLPPIPPEQKPLPRTAPVRHAAAPHPTPVVREQSAIRVPVDPAPPIDIAPVADVPADAPIGDVGGPAGETRQLAYDGALKLRYPVASLRQREQGRVLLNVLVDANGSVQRIEIARSSGHASLDAAARDAVRNAHFKPVLENGKAIAAWGLVPIEFHLDRA
jgi:protein TonB